MEIIIHVELKKLDRHLQLAINEYIKRTSPFCKITIKLYKNIDKISLKSGSIAYRVVPGESSPTSEGLSRIIEEHNLKGISCIEYIIMNSDKEFHPERVLDIFSLSSFSMSPDLTTVVLTEQIYRAYTIMNNITYHK